MATFTGTAANETITPAFVSTTVTRVPRDSVPSDAADTVFAGGGDDRVDGGEGDDVLYGGGGNDSIHGGDGRLEEDTGGDDLVDGGEGDDVLSGAKGNDHIYGGTGNDTIVGDYGHPDYAGYRDWLDGGPGDDVIWGYGRDVIYGGDGNDTIGDAYYFWFDLGGDTLYGGAGNDTLRMETRGSSTGIGGEGNDTYWVFGGGYGLSGPGPGDAVFEADGEGTDSVFVWGFFPYDPDTGQYVTGSYTLPSNVENLNLENAREVVEDDLGNPLLGDALRFNGTGNGLDNVITGNDATNLLLGLGGNDTVKGLGGNDTLWGGEGNDILDGGTGADKMGGGTGTGNDTFYVDNTGDQVVEYTNQGTDSVFSSISYTLAANVEDLTLTGSAALSGTGNTLANFITGNGAANTLNGLGSNDDLQGLTGNDTLYGGEGNDILDGGEGADRMLGGTGDDGYLVDNTGDQVVEYTNQGNDIVLSSISHTLAANVERLTLIDTAAINGTGNGSANVITGNDAANVLAGLAGADTLVGGASGDVLIGGTGPDCFDFDFVSDSTATAWDVIRAGGGAVAFEGPGVARGDLIDLSGFDANTGMDGYQKFASNFGTGAGQISLVNSGTTTLVHGNVGGDATPEFVLAIEDGAVLASAYGAMDFIL